MADKLDQIQAEIAKRFYRWLGLLPLSDQASAADKEIHYQRLMHRFTRRLVWQLVILLPFCVLFLLLGMALAPSQKESRPDIAHAASSQGAKSEKKSKWTCSMHPNIKMNSPGKCPICFMDLVEVKTEDAGDSGDQPRLILSKSARALAEIATAPALYRRLSHTVRMVGKIDYDETRIVNITLWTPGRSRVQRMYLNFTGAQVKQGEPLVEVYSPDMIAAQGEYLSAYSAWQSRSQQASASNNSALHDNLQASRRKLLDLGMTTRQIGHLEQRQQPEEVVRIYSPVSGTVIAKLTNEGEWHNRGMSLYKIADLSQVWARLDAYESDLIWLHYAQKATFIAEAYPGEQFSGRIAFIDPFLQESTRSVKVRVNVANPHGRLKPGMFVRAFVQARLAAGGQVWDSSLVGKWVCPLHPQVIRGKPGKCRQQLRLQKQELCQKWLVPAASQLDNDSQDNILRTRVLTIPRSAPLITGKRAVVYVENKKIVYDDDGQKKGIKLNYLGREVQLGPQAGAYYTVLSGLEEGEQVVTNGAFKIDSALQIQAKPSMMSPAAKKSSEPALSKDKHTPKTTAQIPAYAVAAANYHQQMRPLLEAYLALVADLAGDRSEPLPQYLHQMRQTLGQIDLDKSGLPPAPRCRYQDDLQKLGQALAAVTGTDIAQIRQHLAPLSQALTDYLQDFGQRLDSPLYQMHCPMANKHKGGDWWQAQPQLRNPYFGARMLRCGETRKQLPPLIKGARGRFSKDKAIISDAGAYYHPALAEFIGEYLAIGDNLAKDSSAGLMTHRQKMLALLEQLEASAKQKLPEKVRTRWHQCLASLKQMTGEMHDDSLKQARRDYLDVSRGLSAVEKICRTK